MGFPRLPGAVLRGFTSTTPIISPYVLLAAPAQVQDLQDVGEENLLPVPYLLGPYGEYLVIVFQRLISKATGKWCPCYWFKGGPLEEQHLASVMAARRV